MFREECPEFLNIRLGCWCSNGERVSRAVWILVTIFLQPFVMGTSLGLLKQNICPSMTSTWWSSVVHRTFPLPKLVNPYWNVNRPENPKWTLGIGCRLQETYLWNTKFNNKYQNDLHLTSLGWHWCVSKCLYISWDTFTFGHSLMITLYIWTSTIFTICTRTDIVYTFRLSVYASQQASEWKTEESVLVFSPLDEKRIKVTHSACRKLDPDVNTPSTIKLLCYIRTCSRGCWEMLQLRLRDWYWKVEIFVFTITELRSIV